MELKARFQFKPYKAPFIQGTDGCLGFLLCEVRVAITSPISISQGCSKDQADNAIEITLQNTVWLVVIVINAECQGKT